MGHGTSACYADVIDVKQVKKLVPVAYKNFIKVLKKQKVDLEDFARQYQEDDFQNDICLKGWQILCEAFANATLTKCVYGNSTTLTLRIGFHDIDECGDKYDEVNGVFFFVDGMYQLTGAGMKFDNVVTRKFYTQWG